MTMRLLSWTLAWISAVMALVGFFLPWAMIDLREPELAKQFREASPVRDTLGGLMKDVGRITATVRRGAERVTGELPTLSDIPKQVSGVQIPQLANQEHAQVAIALMELFTNERQQIGAKSYVVYLVPGIAVLCGLLITALVRKKPVMIGVGVLCAAIAGGGFWKLLTTSTQTLFIAITIGQGLWLSLWGYVGLALAAVVGMLVKPRSSSR